jgi:N-carbamoylputrescine amidase
LVTKADRASEGVLVAQFDLDAIAALRASWGLFRDRRPELYQAVGTLDGKV